jgi:hypothetical protein
VKRLIGGFVMKNKIESLKCEKCTAIQLENNFYKPLKKYKICKDCFNQEFMFQYRGIFDTDFGATIEWMCKEYNLPFVQELIYYHEDVLNIKEKLECYMNDISLLPMYQKTDEIKTKSDIDFINDDIKELKIKISKSLEKDDSNAHGKWINSLREALELREKLQGVNNNSSFNISIGEIALSNFDEIIENIKQTMTSIK